MAVNAYYRRVDLAAFHASFLNANSKGKRYTARHVIGDRPILSDEIGQENFAQDFKAALKRIFPKDSGNLKDAKKKKKKKAKAAEGN